MQPAKTAKTAEAQAADQAFIEPPQAEVALRGERTVVVTPLRVREVQAFARAVAPLVDVLPTLLANDPGPHTLVALLDQHSDAIAQCVAVAARMDRAAVDELLPDELLALAAACLEVNVDFFKRALPGMQARGQKLAGLFSAGPTPSSS